MLQTYRLDENHVIHGATTSLQTNGVEFLTDHPIRRTDTLRDVVRHQTDKAHAKLHLHSSFVGLFRGTLDITGYRQLVERFHGFYAPLDRAIEGVLAKTPNVLPPYRYVRRSDFLARDIVDLDGGALGSTARPQCSRAAEIVSPATLGGVLYVIEGATLGASQIDRAAQKLLGHDTVDGRRFWAWGRSRNRKHWSMATTYMDHLHAQGVAEDDIVKGAQDTFEVLADWLAPLDQSMSILSEDHS